MLCQTYALQPLLLAIVLLMPLGGSTEAKDVFLTIGGGYDPSGNQVSLEKNVLFLQKTLEEIYDEAPQHDVYFADGDDPLRDLQYFDEKKAENCPPAERMMSEVLGCAESVGICYRNHQVANVRGPTERGAIQRRLRKLGRELHAGDRLIIYVTGHGGMASSGAGNDDYDYEYDEEEEKWVARSSKGSKQSKHEMHNTTLYLWDTDPIEAREFGRWLDRLSSEVKIVLVMVQCYAGGFAHTIFHRHDPELGISPSQRCGFFAQVHDRGAAGCTPNANDADYQEYSTFFWAALRGKTRLGEPIESADYNKDGQVSLAEAHAYTMIESETIDIPLRTSDALLRHYSRMRKNGESDSDQQGNSVLSFFGKVLAGDNKSFGVKQLDASSGLLADIVAAARPDRQAILTQLAEKLELDSSATIKQVRMKLRQAQGELGKLRVKMNRALAARSEAETDLQTDVYELWPELEERFVPLTAELTSRQGAEFTELVAALPSYQAWSLAREREEASTEAILRASVDEARAQRLIHTLECVVLAANLPDVVPAEIVERYHALVELEEESLNTSAEPETVGEEPTGRHPTTDSLVAPG